MLDPTLRTMGLIGRLQKKTNFDLGGILSRPYSSFQIHQLEADYERAREEGDDQALRNLREELARRRQTPRVTNLRGLIEGYASSNYIEDRPTSSTEQGVCNASAPPAGNEHRDRSDRFRSNQSAPRSTSRARRWPAPAEASV